MRVRMMLARYRKSLGSAAAPLAHHCDHTRQTPRPAHLLYCSALKLKRSSTQAPMIHERAYSTFTARLYQAHAYIYRRRRAPSISSMYRTVPCSTAQCGMWRTRARARGPRGGEGQTRAWEMRRMERKSRALTPHRRTAATHRSTAASHRSKYPARGARPRVRASRPCLQSARPTLARHRASSPPTQTRSRRRRKCLVTPRANLDAHIVVSRGSRYARFARPAAGRGRSDSVRAVVLAQPLRAHCLPARRDAVRGTPLHSNAIPYDATRSTVAPCTQCRACRIDGPRARAPDVRCARR